MKVSIAGWEVEHKIVRITDDEMSTLTVSKHADWDTAFIKLPNVYLGVSGATTMSKALKLAAKVAWYLDDLEPDEALDAIEGLPTTPYDGQWPTPRAGRTEN